jgi:transcriptional regulator with XRE-family HTH domain
VRDVDLGAALKVAREAAELTQTQAGDKIGRSQAKIHRIESGREKVTPTDLQALLRLYAPSADLRERIDALTVPTPAGAPEDTSPNRYFMEMRKVERTASEILLWQSERIAMPLQTDQYTLLQHELAGDRTSPTDLLREKRDRERIITDDDPPRFHAVLAESSLERMPGGRETLVKEQALHLLELVDTYPRFTLQVLHKRAEVAYVDADLTLLKFEGRLKNMVYVAYGADGRLLKEKQQVDEREAYWHTVQRAALSVEKTRQYLYDLAR